MNAISLTRCSLGQDATAAARPVARPVTNLDTVRGLACLLVVALHVVGVTETTGLHLPMTSAWHYAMTSIEFLRIPLFTALSGYLYAGRRATRPRLLQFYSKKMRRLGLPLVFVTATFWGLRCYAYEDTVPFWQALLFSFGHLWYIHALIVLFALIALADAYVRPGAATLALGGLTAILIGQAGLQLPTFFSLYGAVYLAPYFLFGIILRERPDWLADRRSGTLGLGIVLIVLGFQQLGMFDLTLPITLVQLPAAMAGMACVVFLLQRMPRISMLATIGGYSYTIYLWHILPSAALRGLLLRVGVTNTSGLFVACFVAAIALPILLYHVARRLPLISVLATGEHSLGKAHRTASGIFPHRGLPPAVLTVGHQLNRKPNPRAQTRRSAPLEQFQADWNQSA